MKGLTYLFNHYVSLRNELTDFSSPKGFWSDVSYIWQTVRNTTPESARKRFARAFEKYNSSTYGKADVLSQFEDWDEEIIKYIDLHTIEYEFEGGNGTSENPTNLHNGDKIDISVDDENNKTITCKSKRIKTEEDLIRECNIDLTYWEREKFLANKWEVGAKDDTGQIVVEPLFQVKLWLKPRKETIITKEYIESILNDFAKKSPVVPKFRHTQTGEYIYEIGIPDLHFGKLGWDKEVGEDYDVETARELFLWAIDDLLHKVSHVQIDKVVLPIGNDLFQVDNLYNTTTRGTPVDADTRWQRSYKGGINMIIEGIEKCKNVAPVDVIMVPGNHDFERTFYAGDTLSAWYRNDENVTIDNSPKSRKSVEFGNVFIMYTHGNEEKQSQLPLLMFTEFTNSASCKFREIHIGHTHKKKDIHYVYTDEMNGVRVSVLPSLCPPDAWHYKKGFTENIRSAEGRLYNSKYGNCGIFPTNVV